jgi:hypothetical protein
MLKKILFGLVWCVAFYIAGRMLVAGIAGGIAGAKSENMQAASEAGRIAGPKAIAEYHTYIVFGSVTLAVLCTGAGILPGTKSPEPKYDQYADREQLMSRGARY